MLLKYDLNHLTILSFKTNIILVEARTYLNGRNRLVESLSLGSTILFLALSKVFVLSKSHLSERAFKDRLLS